MATVPYGDPGSIRSQAGRLRVEAGELMSILARTATATEYPVSRGAAVDRSREVAAALRERAGWIANRLETLALDLDRGADWLEEAQVAAQAAGDAW